MSRHRRIFHVPSPQAPLPIRLLRPVRWRPLTEAEWAFVRPFVGAANRRGRKLADARARLDACLHGACMAGPWRELPEGFGRADTVSRQFRRWAEAGLWEALLHALAHQGREPGLAGLLYFACRAFRRAHRLLGLAGLRLARALGMDTALRAPRHWLPDPDLSESFHIRELLPGLRLIHRVPFVAAQGLFRRWLRVLSLCKGRARIHRWMAPA